MKTYFQQTYSPDREYSLRVQAKPTEPQRRNNQLVFDGKKGLDLKEAPLLVFGSSAPLAFKESSDDLFAKFPSTSQLLAC